MRTHRFSGPLAALMAIVAAAGCWADAPPAGYEKVDAEIAIAALPAKMKYDRETIGVKPGAKVRLTFTNPDVMQHNFVVTRPGQGVEVAKAAWAMGAEGLAKGFIPQHPALLFHTGLVDPGKSETIYFTAPTVEGDYPFVCTLPGHVYLMNGTLSVGSAPAAGLRAVKYRYYEAAVNSVDKLDALAPKESGDMPGDMIDLHFAKATTNFGAILDAKLDVPADGDYSFFIASDDGSKLLIDGKVVINHDGPHSATQKMGSAKLTKGEHTLTVKYFQGSVDFALSAGMITPRGKRISFSPMVAGGAGDVTSNQLVPTTEPLIVRAVIDGAGARAIAVGFPEGYSYVFDAEECAVKYGWVGGFLDVGPDRGAGGQRGGSPCHPIGNRFSVGEAGGCPLRFTSTIGKPAVAFQGYKRGPVPQLMFSVEGVDVVQSVVAPRAGEAGLTYTFEIANAPGAVKFGVNPAGLKLASSIGAWDGGTLTVPAEQAKKFTVTLMPAQ
jgi:azurin